MEVDYLQKKVLFCFLVTDKSIDEIQANCYAIKQQIKYSFRNVNVIDATLSPSPFRVEIQALVRIYGKLVSNCKVTSKAATSGSVIAKPHSTVEVRTLY